MAKLYFKHGTMASGKSLDLLTTAYNYKKQNKPILIFKPSIENRFGDDVVASRVGFEEKAVNMPLTKQEILSIITSKLEKDMLFAVLVDESQFLSDVQIATLCTVVDDLNIPVICWGLKNDFQNNLFSGSKKLIELADSITALKTICTCCNRKATMNLRLFNGEAVYTGEQFLLGDSEYIPVCRKCYYNYNEQRNLLTS